MKPSLKKNTEQGVRVGSTTSWRAARFDWTAPGACGMRAFGVWVVFFSCLDTPRGDMTGHSEVMCLVLDEADRMLDMGRSPVG